MKKVTILGVNVTDIDLAAARRLVRRWLSGPDQHYIVTPNPEIVLMACRKGKLRAIFDRADLALPDGFGLKIGAKILGQKLEHRLTGADFMLEIIAIAAEQGAPIFLLGGRNEVAHKAAGKLKSLYPNLQIAGDAGGGEVKKTDGKWQAADPGLIERINAGLAQIIFVGFGCPKQERWIYDNLHKLENIKLAMAVGGSLDYLAGVRRRAPRPVRRLGLEWLWRLINEPARAPRMWNATVKFLYQTIVWKIRMQTSYRNNVAGFIVNHKNQVLLVERANEKKEHWQLPQGGVDANETDEQAVLREMREEAGADSLKIIGRHPRRHTYDWSPWHCLRGGYKGQTQTIFYLLFDAVNDKIAIDEKEIKSYQWLDLDKVVSAVHHLRRPMTEMAVEGYKSLLV